MLVGSMWLVARAAFSSFASGSAVFIHALSFKNCRTFRAWTSLAVLSIVTSAARTPAAVASAAMNLTRHPKVKSPRDIASPKTIFTKCSVCNGTGVAWASSVGDDNVEESGLDPANVKVKGTAIAPAMNVRPANRAAHSMPDFGDLTLMLTHHGPEAPAA